MIHYEVWAAEPCICKDVCRCIPGDGFARARLIFREGELKEALVSVDRLKQIGKKLVRVEKVERTIIR